jgi:glucose/mannose-6-phosphate isomerase
MPLDSQNMLQVIKDFPKQAREALDLPRGISIPGEITSIVVIGMGGSAVGGDLLKSYLHDSNLPVFVVRDYKVPEWVDSFTLVFAISYSGNTEETLSAFRHAKEKGAKIIGITSGGILAEECEKVIQIPSGLQPRAALGYIFFPILGVLHNSEIVNVKNSELNEMLFLIKNVDGLNAEAEALARKLKDKIPIVYASELLKPVAFRWKTQVNENSKSACFYNVFSEMNHNEIAGYKGMDRKYTAILLRDPYDNERVKKRMEICKGLMQQTVDVEEVPVKGESLLARMISTIYLGDFVSYCLALSNRVDPSPVEIIESLKKKLVE